jgi:hypothetical protein
MAGGSSRGISRGAEVVIMLQVQMKLSSVQESLERYRFSPVLFENYTCVSRPGVGSKTPGGA